ncbi:MAG: outer membrane protein assembly factor BamD, partial [Methyloceanibacter sp.]
MTLRRLGRAATPLAGGGTFALPAKLLFVLVAASLVSACSSFGSFGSLGWFGGKDNTEDVSNDPPNVIYGKAEALVNKGKYKDAARVYEEVDINHPSSPEARRAILMASYAYYKGGKYDDAIGAAD